MPKDQEITDVIKKNLDMSKDERTRWEARVATCMSFAEGEHRTWWDDSGVQQFYEIKSHETWRQINLIPRALSVITTRVTANNPRWTPRKSGLENVSRDEISAANALLQDVWDGEELGEYSMKNELKMVIRNAFLQGGCLAYIRFDEEFEMPVMESFELWDVYSDPSSQRLRDKRWLYIAQPQGLDALEANELLDKVKVKKIQSDQRLAESKLKEGHIQRVSGNRNSGVNTIMTYHTFTREGKNIIHRIVAADQVLYEETLEHPEDKTMTLATIFDIYHPVETGQFYARPEVSDWIDPQKSINKMYSNVENYIDMFLQGRWMRTDESVEIPRAGVMGQIIDAAPGELQAFDLAPLPGTHFEHGRQSVAHFEQISGVHSETMGRQSGSAESGVAIAQLQALDEQNSSDAVDNFKQFLSRVGLKLLFQASANWNSVKKLYRYDQRTGEETELNVIGEQFAKERKETLPVGTVSLRPFKRMDVEIVVGQFFEKAHKREEITSLLQSGWTPGNNPVLDSVILDSYDIGVGREIVDELKALQNPEMMIAKGKAAKIVNGDRVEVVPNDPHQFLQDFYAKQAEIALQEGDQNAARLLNAQAQRHGAFLQQGTGGVGTPLALGQE